MDSMMSSAVSGRPNKSPTWSARVQDRSVAASARRATVKDAEAIATLVNAAYQAEHFFVEGNRTNTTEIVEMLNQGEFLVIDGTDGLAGTVFLRAYDVANGNSYISMVAVAPNLQGAGIGSRLLGTAEALAAALGCQTATLQVVNVREDLVRWYKAAGYQPGATQPYTHRPTKIPCYFVTFSKQICH
jgi:ribosomal protein S18 acetylase RimI-like enzyme